MADPHTSTPDDRARLDLGLMAVALLCGLGFAVDLSEIVMGGVLSTVFSAPPQALDPGRLSWLVSAAYVGAVVGAPLLGWIADRRGARGVLAGALVWLAATSLWAALAHGPGELTLARLASGVALGAYPPLMIAYLAALAPPSRRGSLVFLACAVGYLGPPATIFAVRALGPAPWLGLDGWRWPFVVGAVLAALAALGFLRAPKPGVQEDAAPATADRAPAWRRRLIVLGLYMLNPWFVAAFTVAAGPLLLARGYNLSQALLFVGISTFGPTFGSLLSGLIVDGVGRRTALAACSLLLLVAIVAFFAIRDDLVLAVVVGLYGLVGSLYLPVMTLYGAELTPAASRHGFTALAWGGNRLASALMPLVLVPWARAGDGLRTGLVIGLALLASVVLIALPPARTADPHKF